MLNILKDTRFVPLSEQRIDHLTVKLIFYQQSPLSQEPGHPFSQRSGNVLGVDTVRHYVPLAKRFDLTCLQLN